MITGYRDFDLKFDEVVFAIGMALEAYPSGLYEYRLREVMLQVLDDDESLRDWMRELLEERDLISKVRRANSHLWIFNRKNVKKYIAMRIPFQHADRSVEKPFIPKETVIRRDKRPDWMRQDPNATFGRVIPKHLRVDKREKL